MRFSRHGRLGKIVGAAGAALPVVLATGALVMPSTASAQPTLVSATYSGRSCDIMIQNLQILGGNPLNGLLPGAGPVNGLTECVGDSGQVPAAGGVATAPTQPLALPPLLSVDPGVLTASAGGANGVSNASAAVAGASILVPGVANLPALPPIAGTTGLLPLASAPLVHAHLLAADTSVSCGGPTAGTLVGNPPGLGIASPSGTGAATRVQSVQLSGADLTSQITGQPNQVLVNLPGIVTITLNEQTYDAASNTATGNAVDINLQLSGILTGRIIIAHAESDLTGCVFQETPKTPALPPTGSLAPMDDRLTGTGAGAVAKAVTGAGVAAIVASGLVFVRRRRQGPAATEGHDT